MPEEKKNSSHNSDLDIVHFIEPQRFKLMDFECKDDLILDIGGGGEGVIGKLKGKLVISIDRQKRELEETDDESLKIVMDATDLKFLDKSFYTVTSFFTLLYIPDEEKLDKIFSEIYRVLKSQGEFLIWDVIFEIPKNTSKTQIATYLKVDMPDGTLVDTGYGTRMHAQDISDFLELAKNHNFKVIEEDNWDKVFFIRLKKGE
jgi:ubiquinone/menaquinone biosynthesis C-methylase UbiE